MNIIIEDAVNLLGILTYTYLFVLTAIALVIFGNNREKLFLYYSLYTFFLMIYVISKASIPNNEFSIYYHNSNLYVFNFFVQVIFHCFYLLFGCLFLNIPRHYPRLYFWIKTYSKVIFLVSLVYAILVVAEKATLISYGFYFQFIFTPIQIGIALFIVYKSLITGETDYRYFLIGTVVFIILAMTAAIKSRQQSEMNKALDFHAINYFFIGVLIESSIFVTGLGFRIRKLYRDKLNYQKQLTIVQQKLNVEANEKLKSQQIKLDYIVKQNEIKELENSLYKLQGKVIRSQMNSHFLFNVLNSIKAFVIENNTSEAVTYLNKFAKFIRKVLDSSMYDTHTLKEELNMLELYLDIENMRMSNQLNFQFYIDPQVNTSHIKLPSFLLQPFVENSIWHGLASLSSNRDKNLEISVTAVNKGIEVVILDNGVGYRHSLKTASNTTTHKSYGLLLINERINQFNQSTSNSISYTIADRTDGLQGTAVTILFV